MSVVPEISVLVSHVWPERTGERCAFLSRTRRDHHSNPGLMERLGDCPADARGATRDDGNFFLQSAHWRSSHVRAFATMKPDMPPRPGPGWVDAPM